MEEGKQCREIYSTIFCMLKISGHRDRRLFVPQMNWAPACIQPAHQNCLQKSSRAVRLCQQPGLLACHTPACSVLNGSKHCERDRLEQHSVWLLHIYITSAQWSHVFEKSVNKGARPKKIRGQCIKNALWSRIWQGEFNFNYSPKCFTVCGCCKCSIAYFINVMKFYGQMLEAVFRQATY